MNHIHDPEHLREALTKAKQGDTEAFTVLYESYYTPVYRFLRARLSDPMEAEDLTQTVFMKVFHKLDQLESRDDVTPLAYFLSVARNALIDWFRKKKAINLDPQDYSFESIADPQATPDESTHALQEKHTLHLRLQKLKPDHREVLTLKYIDGLKAPEIAQIMGKSPDAIRQLLVRALSSLRKHYHLS